MRRLLRLLIGSSPASGDSYSERPSHSRKRCCGVDLNDLPDDLLGGESHLPSRLVSFGEVGGAAHVSCVTSGGDATGGATGPVGATGVLATHLAIATVGTDLGRHRLARRPGRD